MTNKHDATEFTSPPDYQASTYSASNPPLSHLDPQEFGRDDLSDAASNQPPSYVDVTGISGHLPAPSEQERKSYKVVSGVPVIVNERLDNDPSYLEDTIRALAPMPPQPTVKIKGTHREVKYKVNTHGTTKRSNKTVVDFDITLDLTSYLMNQSDVMAGLSSTLMRLQTVENDVKTYRGSVLRSRTEGWNLDPEGLRPKPDLREWCHRYCGSSSQLKIFHISRKVTGLNTHFLESRLRELVQRTNYRGNVDITFPVQSESVDIYSDSIVNRCRLVWWLRFFFYLTFLFLLSWPILFFATKRYSVVEVVWPFSYVDDAGRIRYASISENAWFEQWHRAIERAVLRKQRRTLGATDLLEAAATDVEPRPSGNGIVDGAVRLVAASAHGLQEVNRQLGWGHDSS